MPTAMRVDVPVPPASAMAAPSRGASAREERVAGYAFVSPFFIVFGVFGLFPIVFTLWVSLHDWSLLGGKEGWVGLANYSALLPDDNFWNALVNTLGIFLLATVPQLLLALGLAQLLNQRLRGADVLADGRAAAQHHLGRRGRHHLHAAVRPRLRAGQLAARLRRGGADRLAGPPVVVVAGDLGDGRLAVDRLQRPDLPGRAAGRAEGPLRSGSDRRRLERGGSSGASRCPLLRPTIVFVTLISTIGGIQLFTEPLLFNSGANAITGGTTRQFQTLTMYLYEKAFTGSTSATPRRSPG